MKQLILSIFAMITLASVAQQKQSEYSNNKLIIKFKQAGIQEATERNRLTGEKMVAFGIDAIDRLNTKYSVSSAKPVFPENKDVIHPASLKDVYVLVFSAPENMEALVKEYMATGMLEYAHPDFIGHNEGGHGNSASAGPYWGTRTPTNVVPNDPYFSNSWNLSNNGTFVITGGNPKAVSGADIKMECGWGAATGAGDTNIIVAVLDCGCQINHPDLAGRIWRNYKDIMKHTAKGWVGNGKDDEGDGYVDDWRGWDFAYDDTNVIDNQGHGTNVAGIIGANGNNSLGYAGMNWGCKLMIVKVNDDNGDGNTSWWASGVTYAADHGANIINMSLEDENDDSVSDPTFQSAIDYAYNKGILVVAAMGNNDNNTPTSPADMNHVMSVGATTTNDTRAVPLGGTESNALPGSNYNTYISVVAPGDEIYGLNNSLPDSYTWFWYGTSQAAPQVCGLASLMLSVKPSLTNNEIQKLIEETADKGTGLAHGDNLDKPTSFNQYYGYGRINACRALDTLVNNITTGISNASPAVASVVLYPNPFSDKAQLELSGINNGQFVTVTIYNVQGREIKQIYSDNSQIVISRDGMSSGVYFYRVTSAQGILSKGKFIVTNN